VRSKQGVHGNHHPCEDSYKCRAGPRASMIDGGAPQDKPSSQFSRSRVSDGDVALMFKTRGTREVRYLTIESRNSGDDPPLRPSAPAVGWGSVAAEADRR
jgi:hypothetical protein